MDRAMDLLLWNTRRAIFHEIAERRGVTYSAVGACLALSCGENYLEKEAVTRIKRVLSTGSRTGRGRDNGCAGVNHS